MARSHDPQLLAIGTVCAAGGIYFVLVGCGLAPPPSKLNGPQWLATCIGLVFLAGGVMVLVRGWLGVADSQDLPDRPRRQDRTGRRRAGCIVAGSAGERAARGRA